MSTVSNKLKRSQGRRYAQPKAIERDYGISRTKQTELLRAKLIRGARLPRPESKGTASKKCVLLIDIDSLEEFLDQIASASQEEAAQ